MRWAPSVFLLLSAFALASLPRQEDATPEQRAVAFLSREVPRWPAENRCYSCHNNGDAARALYQAVKQGYDVPPEALRATSDWLSRPETWDGNGGNGVFDDRTLARIQFASALLASRDAGHLAAPDALRRAGDLVAADQAPDGSWRLDSSASIGSPATYGRFLATAAARDILRASGPDRFADGIARADRWLRQVEVKTVLDAAAVILALRGETDAAAIEQQLRGLEIVRRGRAPSGGWGAYVTSAPEPFDTAVVLLALRAVSEEPSPLLEESELQQALAGGRRFLLDTQLPDGSWPETTRPAGQQSYAQYISTTGWATLALLATGASATASPPQ